MVVTTDPAPRALRKLFLDLFTASELRRLVSDYYDDAANSLPLGGSSEEFAASVVEVLARFGHIEPRLFARILAERPHQSAAVRRCAAVWGLEPAGTAADQVAIHVMRSGSLLGKYRLIERIGHGGFGSVWTCEAPGGDVVAVKILRPDYGSEPRLVARFFHGAARMTGFSDPMFVRLLEPRCEEQGIFFYVMSHVDGPSLDQALRKQNVEGTRLLPQMIELGRALGRAHRSGRIHRDIKPGNIIVDRQGRLYLTDFDFVGLLEGPLHTLTTTVTSHDYTAPEVIRGAPADIHAEVYSFARTVLFLLHGETSASGAPGKPASSSSTQQLESVLARGCAHESHARYPDMDALCDAMAMALEAHQACPPWPDLKIDMTMRVGYRAAESYEDREMPLRILLIGDFSQGGSGGQDQRTVRINQDSIDQALKSADLRVTTRIALRSPIDVELRIRSMSDFHPDILIQQIPELVRLQLRRDALRHFKNALGNTPALARHLLAYTRAAVADGPDQGPPPEISAKLLDFVRLDSSEGLPEEVLSILIKLAIQRRSATSASVREIIDGLIRDIDEQLSTAFDSILHDPELVKFESAWRSLQFLATRLNLGEHIYLEYLNVSRDDLLVDLAESPELKRTSLYALLFGSTFAVFGGWPYGLVCSLHPIPASRDGIVLATSFAEVAACTQTPVLLAAPPLDAWQGAKRRTLEHDWQAFRETDAAAYVCLCPGTFRLRAPYGHDPRGPRVRAFHYKENLVDPSRELPIATPALALAARIGESFTRHRWYSEIRGLVRLDVPAELSELWATGAYAGTSPTLQDCANLARLGYVIPLPEDSGHALNFAYINIFKPRPAAVSPATDGDPERFQDALDARLVGCRFAQFVMLMYRENIGRWGVEEAEEVSRLLEAFLRQFVCEIQDPAPTSIARKPLHKASLRVEEGRQSEVSAGPPRLRFTLLLVPHVARGGASFMVRISGHLR